MITILLTLPSLAGIPAGAETASPSDTDVDGELERSSLSLPGWVNWASLVGRPVAYEGSGCGEPVLALPDPHCATALDAARTAAESTHIALGSVVLGKGISADLMAAKDTCGSASLLLDTIVDLPAGTGDMRWQMERFAAVLSEATGERVMPMPQAWGRQVTTAPTLHGPARGVLTQLLNPRTVSTLQTYSVSRMDDGVWRIAAFRIQFQVLPEELSRIPSHAAQPGEDGFSWLDASEEEKAAVTNGDRKYYDVPEYILLAGPLVAEEAEMFRRCKATRP